MAYLFEEQTGNKANEMIKNLEKAGYQAEMLEDPFRDYSVRFDITARGEYMGRITIYYKPTKNIYKIRIDEVKESEKSAVQKIWEDMGMEIKTMSFTRSDFEFEKSAVTYTNSGVEIDVDGSFRDGKTSYAAIVRREGLEVKRLCGLMEAKEVMGSHQVAGELRAAIEAIKYCAEHHIPEAVIYYDMKGTEFWATGRWKANKEITKLFQEFIKKVNVKITWVKVKSHSGMKWNEAVDELAASMFNG